MLPPRPAADGSAATNGGRPLLRLVTLVTAVATLIAATLATLAGVADHAIHHSASAVDLPLAPLTADTLDGSTVYGSDGKTVLAVLRGPKKEIPVPLQHVSPLLIRAVLDTEDHDFYVHGGFDVQSIVRAFVHDASGNGLQGGSTIAQQLVKKQYLSSARNLSRKIKEAVLADRLERKYSKNQILQAYLNTVYLGSGAYGVEAAAETYFHESASAVTLPQAALLAGMIQDPNGYDPVLAPRAARDRRAQVLDRMVVYKDVTSDQATAADRSPLPTVVPPPASDPVSNYYVEQVKSQLLAAGSPLGGTYAERYDALFNGGLKIYTNLDPALQAQAEHTVQADTPANNGGFQQALVSIDPATGKVLALVGGTGTVNSKFDIVTQGARQPGSGFKLFTLVAALELGYTINDTILGTSPCAIDFPTDHDLVTHPANNDEGNGGGVMRILDATAQSTNCAFIRLAHEVGLPKVIEVAHQLGITENLPPYPSIVIGSIAVHPMEMAAAYAAVADGGVYRQPSFIDHIADPSGHVMYSGEDPGRRVMSAGVAAQADAAFQAVVQAGTGTGAAIAGRPVAGKTGTTNQNVDAWFNGFTPQMETTVWMGNPTAEVPMSDVGGIAVYGGTYPAHTWHDYMAAALGSQPVAGFPALPSNLPSRYITSPGLVANDALAHNQPGPSYPPFTPSPPASPSPPAGPGPAPVPARGPVPTPAPGGRHHH